MRIDGRVSSSRATLARFRCPPLSAEMRDGGGATVYEESFGLGGTPDPTVTAFPGVVGRTVVLVFAGHEDQICGGFSELTVVVAR